MYVRSVTIADAFHPPPPVPSNRRALTPEIASTRIYVESEKGLRCVELGQYLQELLEAEPVDTQTLGG